jgi:AcrR family transcriptional regulator
MLAAARVVIAERGFAGATLDEIAARAEFGKGTLYNYFPGGKDEILYAIVAQIYDELVALIDDSFPGGTAEEWARHARTWFYAFIERCFAYFDSEQDLFVILTREAHRMCFSDNSERLAFFLGQRARIAHALAGPVESAIQAGAMRPLPAHAVAHMILGNISGLQLHRSLENEGGCTMTSARSDQEANPASFLSSFLFDGLLTDQEPPPHAPH